MQLELALDSRSNLLAEVYRRLSGVVSPPVARPRLGPLRQLVLSMISGRTRDDVSRGAFARLMARYDRCERLRDADLREIKHLIRDVTFADVKAARLKQTLCIVTQLRGRLALDHLDHMALQQALAWLEQLPGVGRKVSASVLNLSTLRKPALVLDMHHLRILRRLGLIGQRDNTVGAYDRVAPLLPARWTAGHMEAHHHQMKTLGQTTCRSGRPNCAACPLSDICPTGRIRSDAVDEPHCGLTKRVYALNHVLPLKDPPSL